MMKIFLLKELDPAETRVALIPQDVGKLTKKGMEVIVESGLGERTGYSDQDYAQAGAVVQGDRGKLFTLADIVLRIGKPTQDEIAGFKRGLIHISFLDPFNEKELITKLAASFVSALSLEMVPRTTRAQKMDALSSQASIAGYNAVILAAERSNKILPMMTTPSGTIAPARVFIIGAGVAGLQAIATARRLGARVEAFDTRPVVEEQVKSLGAKFVKVDLGEVGQTKDGYAQALTPEQIQKQQEVMTKTCALSDIVITTAQVFGKKAPRIMTEEMVKGMRPGSIIVDMAVESGGNVAGSRPGEEVIVGGVIIMGHRNLAGRSPLHASQMLSTNFYNLLNEMWDDGAKGFSINTANDIIKGALITHGGVIVHDLFKGGT